jgi:hypothetical protein
MSGPITIKAKIIFMATSFCVWDGPSRVGYESPECERVATSNMNIDCDSVIC